MGCVSSSSTTKEKEEPISGGGKKLENGKRVNHRNTSSIDALLDSQERCLFSGAYDAYKQASNGLKYGNNGNSENSEIPSHLDILVKNTILNNIIETKNQNLQKRLDVAKAQHLEKIPEKKTGKEDVVVGKVVLEDVIEEDVDDGGCGNLTLDVCFKNCKIGPQGCVCIIEMLVQQCNVRSFKLINCGLTHLGCIEIGRSLRFNTQLEVLDLSGNNIDHTENQLGIRGLLKYIYNNKTLLELYLRNCNIDETSCCLLINKLLLSDNCTLKLLDLSNNKLGSQCIEGLARALECNFGLLKLDLTGNKKSTTARTPTTKKILLDHQNSSSTVSSVGSATNSDASLQNNNNNNNKFDEDYYRQRINNLLERNQAVTYVIDKMLDSVFTSDENSIKITIPKEKVAMNGQQEQPNCAVVEENSRFNFGFAETRGRRQRMEDVILLKTKFRGNENEKLFGIFDGHGGCECARFCCRYFVECFENELNAYHHNANNNNNQINGGMKSGSNSKLNIEKNIKSCIYKTFLMVQEKCRKLEIQSGSCVILGYIVGEKAYIVSIGDSRALLTKKNNSAKWVSDIISPTQPSERSRIESQGGFVTGNGRVCGVLAVSRALGDCQYANIISSEPTIQVLKFGRDDKWLVFGCDGVWDVLEENDTVELLKYVTHPERAAQKIRDAAFQNGSRDNISAVCVKLF